MIRYGKLLGVVLFCGMVWRIAVKKRVGAVVLLDQFFKVLASL